MDDLHIGTQSVRFDAPPSILSFAAIGGKKEQEGPLASYFDFLSGDTTFGQKSWEKAESELQKRALDTALHKLDVKYKDLDALFAGDLLNQCIGSAFAMRETGIPFLGLYGACSTMAESLLLASAAVNAGYAHRAAALTSSHFASAERQYRFPLGYGGQRTPTAQWTATAAGCCVVGARVTRAIRHGVRPWAASSTSGIKDANNMGAAIGPGGGRHAGAALSGLRRLPYRL